MRDERVGPVEPQGTREEVHRANEEYRDAVRNDWAAGLERRIAKLQLKIARKREDISRLEAKVERSKVRLSRRRGGQVEGPGA